MMTTTDTATMLLMEFFETVYRPLRLPGGADSTLKTRRMTIDQFSEFLGHEATIGDLTNKNVTGFCWARTDAGLSKTTAKNQGSYLLALWRCACQEGFEIRWPAKLVLPDPPVRDPVAYTRDQLRALFAALSRVTGSLCGVPSNLWLLALHSIQWDTAERIGAVRLLRWDDINLDTCMVTFRYENRKGKKRDNTQPLHPGTIEQLQAIQQPTRDLVFPWPYCESYLWPWYSKILRRADLPFGRDYKFHAMRRSSASWIEAAGMNATAILGHSSRAVTERSYIDPRIVRRTGAAEVLFRPTDTEYRVEKPDPSVILFSHEYSPSHSVVALNGEWQRMGKLNALLLESLFNAGHDGVHRDDLCRNLDIDADTIYARVGELKAILMKVFGFPETHSAVERQGPRFFLRLTRSKKQERRQEPLPVRETPEPAPVDEHDYGFMV